MDNTPDWQGPGFTPEDEQLFRALLEEDEQRGPAFHYPRQLDFDLIKEPQVQSEELTDDVHHLTPSDPAFVEAKRDAISAFGSYPNHTHGQHRNYGYDHQAQPSFDQSLLDSNNRPGNFLSPTTPSDGVYHSGFFGQDSVDFTLSDANTSTPSRPIPSDLSGNFADTSLHIESIPFVGFTQQSNEFSWGSVDPNLPDTFGHPLPTVREDEHSYDQGTEYQIDQPPPTISTQHSQDLEPFPVVAAEAGPSNWWDETGKSAMTERTYAHVAKAPYQPVMTNTSHLHVANSQMRTGLGANLHMNMPHISITSHEQPWGQTSQTIFVMDGADTVRRNIAQPLVLPMRGRGAGNGRSSSTPGGRGRSPSNQSTRSRTSAISRRSRRASNNILSPISTASHQWHCRQCGMFLPSKRELELHARKHDEAYQWACEDCSLVWRKETELKHHIRNVHRAEEDKKWACRTCEKRFTCKRYLTRHEHTHSDNTPRPFQCLICPDTYLTRYDNVRKHYRKFHPGYGEPGRPYPSEEDCRRPL